MALSSVDSKVLLVPDILQSEIITITNISNTNYRVEEKTVRIFIERVLSKRLKGFLGVRAHTIEEAIKFFFFKGMIFSPLETRIKKLESYLGNFKF